MPAKNVIVLFRGRSMPEWLERTAKDYGIDVPSKGQDIEHCNVYGIRIEVDHNVADRFVDECNRSDEVVLAAYHRTISNI